MTCQSGLAEVVAEVEFHGPSLLLGLGSSPKKVNGATALDCARKICRSVSSSFSCGTCLCLTLKEVEVKLEVDGGRWTVESRGTGAPLSPSSPFLKVSSFRTCNISALSLPRPSSALSPPVFVYIKVAMNNLLISEAGHKVQDDQLEDLHDKASIMMEETRASPSKVHYPSSLAAMHEAPSPEVLQRGLELEQQESVMSLSDSLKSNWRTLAYCFPYFLLA